MKKIIICLILIMPFIVNAKVTDNNLSNMKIKNTVLWDDTNKEGSSHSYEYEYKDEDVEVTTMNNKMVFNDLKTNKISLHKINDNDGIYNIKKFGKNLLIIASKDYNYYMDAIYLVDKKGNILATETHDKATSFEPLIINDKYYITMGKNYITIYDTNLKPYRQYYLNGYYDYGYISVGDNCAYITFDNCHGYEEFKQYGIYLDFNNLPSNDNIKIIPLNFKVTGLIESVIEKNGIYLEKDNIQGEPNKELLKIKIIDQNFNTIKEKELTLNGKHLKLKALNHYIYAYSDNIKIAYKIDKDLNIIGETENPFYYQDKKDKTIYDHLLKEDENPKYTIPIKEANNNIIYGYRNKDNKYEIRVFNTQENKDSLILPYEFGKIKQIIKYEDYYIVAGTNKIGCVITIYDKNLKLIKSYTYEGIKNNTYGISNLHVKKEGFYLIFCEDKNAPDVKEGLKAQLVEFNLSFFTNIINSQGGQIITTSKSPMVGEQVKIDIKPIDGYIIKNIIVLDSENNQIPVINNTFEMPNSDVNVKAEFIKIEDNPETSDYIILTIFVLFVSGSAIFTIYKKKKFLE